MDLSQFDFSGLMFGMSGVLSICAVIYLSSFVLRRLEMHP